MTVIRQNPESLRPKIDEGLNNIILELRQAGWSSEQIKKELHEAVKRVLTEKG
jgi:hypothetical protein